MNLDDTIKTLKKTHQSIKERTPETTTHPDALIAELNKLYVSSTDNDDFDDLFEFNDVGSPSITLVVDIEVDFNIHSVVENMRKKLNIRQPNGEDEIGNACIVWSHGRYDFVYSEESGSLRISHKYSHKRVDTKSVSSIAKSMIEYGLHYLEEVKASLQQGTGTLKKQ